MDRKKAPRNGLIDLARLGFAGVVMMFHFYSNGKKHFPGGFLGVEFFAILAGFLMYSAWDRHQVAELPMDGRQQYWLGYMKKRYIRFFWYGLVAFIAAFFVLRIWRDGVRDIAGISDALSADIWEILQIKMLGLNRGGGLLNSPAWTMGCMLFAEFFILGMLTFFKRHFIVFAMPLSVIFGIGYWMNVENTSVWKFHTFFTFGMLRIYILSCIGIFSYLLCKKLKEIPFSHTGRWALTVAELLGYAVCVLIILYRNSIYDDFCFILLATLALAQSFSGKSFAGSMLPANTFTNFCAELSLSLYLTHRPVSRVFQDILFKSDNVNDLYRQKFIFLYCALAIALAYTYIMRGVFKMLPIVKEKLKSVMLEQS